MKTEVEFWAFSSHFQSISFLRVYEQESIVNDLIRYQICKHLTGCHEMSILPKERLVEASDPFLDGPEKK